MKAPQFGSSEFYPFSGSCHVPLEAAIMGDTDFEDYAADLAAQNAWALEAEAPGWEMVVMLADGWWLVNGWWLMFLIG